MYTIKRAINSLSRLPATGSALSTACFIPNPHGIDPMSRKSISLAVIVLAAICFIAGWLSYEWVLHCVTAKIERRIVFSSVQETFNHRLMLSLSFALVGASTGFGALLSGRFSARYRYGGLRQIEFWTIGSIKSMFDLLGYCL